MPNLWLVQLIGCGAGIMYGFKGRPRWREQRHIHGRRLGVCRALRSRCSLKLEGEVGIDFTAGSVGSTKSIEEVA